MAIKPATGYMAREGPVVPVKKAAVPKGPVINLKGMNLTSGYGAGPTGGWTYPLAQTGVTGTYNSTGATYQNVPPSGEVPFSPGNEPVYSTPSVDQRPPAQRINQPINYQPSLDEINADPSYKAALDAYNTQKQSWLRSLGLNIAQRAIGAGYGDIADKLRGAGLSDDYLTGLTPDVLQQAADNPFSENAQITQNYNRAMQDNAYQQAARGTLGSGAQVTARNTLDQGAALNRYQGMQSLIAGAQGDVGNYLQNSATGYTNLQNTREAVASRLSQLQGAAYGIGNDVGGYEAGYQTVPGTGGVGPSGAPGVPSSAPGVPGSVTPSGQTQGGGIQWAGQTVTSVAQMKRILNASGVSYARWAANHDAAAKKLEGRG